MPGLKMSTGPFSTIFPLSCAAQEINSESSRRISQTGKLVSTNKLEYIFVGYVPYSGFVLNHNELILFLPSRGISGRNSASKECLIILAQKTSRWYVKADQPTLVTDSFCIKS